MQKDGNKKVAIHTLGCKLNFSESSEIGRQLEANGYERIPFGQEADVSLIHTCTVTGSADRKTRQAIRKARQASPSGVVVAMGCYAQLQGNKIIELEGVDLVLGNKEKFDLLTYLDQFEEKQKPIVQACDIDQVDRFSAAQSIDERTRAFLKVQDGCDYNCSYCTIPAARGKSRNPKIQTLVEQTQNILSKGIAEIVLTGVNTGDFGKSTKERFIDLVTELDALDGKHRFRISSIEPNLISHEVIDRVRDSRHFTPHFHIPLQAGSDEILKKMRRRYLRDTFKERVEYIRQVLPEAGIGADVIVGFPGETDQHFEEARQFLTDLPLSYLHVFTYSERPGTPATEIRPIVPNRVRDERSAILHELSDEKKLSFMKQQQGSIREVIFEGKNQAEMMTGFTDNYVEVCHPYQPERIKQITPVKLVEPFSQQSMIGEIVKT